MPLGADLNGLLLDERAESRQAALAVSGAAFRSDPKGLLLNAQVACPLEVNLQRTQPRLAEAHSMQTLLHVRMRGVDSDTRNWIQFCGLVRGWL